jgi:hypothetical protein
MMHDVRQFAGAVASAPVNTRTPAPPVSEFHNAFRKHDYGYSNSPAVFHEIKLITRVEWGTRLLGYATSRKFARFDSRSSH